MCLMHQIWMSHWPSDFEVFIHCASLCKIPGRLLLSWFCICVVASRCGLFSSQIWPGLLVTMAAPGNLSQSASDHTWPTDWQRMNMRKRNFWCWWCFFILWSWFHTMAQYFSCKKWDTLIALDHFTSFCWILLLLALESEEQLAYNFNINPGTVVKDHMAAPQ